MSPRPRTISDDDIFAAAHRAMFRLGPVNLTLADVAREAGISPATLVQRFGSKRGLLLAVSTAAAEGNDACFDMLRAGGGSPLEMLISAAMFMTQSTNTPEEMANTLAFLQIDLTDPDFHRLTLKMSKQMEAQYVRLADEAVAAGELVPCDTAALCRALGAVATGSLIGWAIYRDGRAEDWVRRDVETLLASYRATRTTPTTRTSRTTRTTRTTRTSRTSRTSRTTRTSERRANRPQVRKKR